jgi:hypothetical protein
MRHPALPLTPALSRKGRGSTVALATASFLPLREKDRMRGFDVSRINDSKY